MAAVKDVLARKGRTVVTCGDDATVLQACLEMTERGIGAVLVVDAAGALQGIFTERDVLRRVVAEKRDPAATPLREVMTTSVITCSPGTALEECGAVMTARRIRHLPVVGDAGLVGILSSGDLLAYRTDEQQATIEQLHSYVFDLR
jgi:CBS domain-containing protein